MKLKTLLYLLLSISTIIIFSGCGDDNDDTEESISQSLDRKLLTEKLWKCEKMLYNGSDFSHFVDKSTISFKYNEDGSYRNTFMNKETSGKWELVPDKKQLRMDKGTANDILIDVTLLDEHKLNIEFDEPDNDKKYKVQYDLIH